jgi:hypothetical protein
MLNQTTDVLYAHARDRAQRGQFWSMLIGRSRCLLTLDEIKTACTAHPHPHAQIRTVPIEQIRGSESRSGDFDRDFNPLQDHHKRRWLSVAGARERGKALPPVELIQVGDVYFVRDGHHRVSVARALGQRNIEARIVVWQVSGSLPWETPARTAAYSFVGRLSLRALLIAIGAKLKARNPWMESLHRPPDVGHSPVDVLP